MPKMFFQVDGKMIRFDVSTDNHAKLKRTSAAFNIDLQSLAIMTYRLYGNLSEDLLLKYIREELEKLKF